MILKIKNYEVIYMKKYDYQKPSLKIWQSGNGVKTEDVIVASEETETVKDPYKD